MKKIMYGIIGISLVGLILFASCSFINQAEKEKTYRSLDNVFKEMSYAEFNSENILNLPDLSTVMKSKQSYKEPGSTFPLDIPVSTFDKDEMLTFYISKNDLSLLEYRKRLTESSFLFINYTYENNKLTEKISVVFSDISDEYVHSQLKIGRTKGEDISDEEAEKTIYWFASSQKKKSDTPPITAPDKVLEYLKAYNIDKAWLEKKSHEILYDDVLKVWFEKGSKRYSFKNLGDLKIERAEMFR